MAVHPSPHALAPLVLSAVSAGDGCRNLPADMAVDTQSSRPGDRPTDSSMALLGHRPDAVGLGRDLLFTMAGCNGRVAGVGRLAFDFSMAVARVGTGVGDTAARDPVRLDVAVSRYQATDKVVGVPIRQKSVSI